MGLVLDRGGKDDKSFNASAFTGATRAKNELNIHLKVLECSSDSAFVPTIRTFAQHGYDLIIGIGFVQKSAIEAVAKQFPRISFLLIDAPSSLPNVRSVIFQEHEGSYLVGTIAALSSKTKTVGFIGGMDIPLIRRFELGYRTGATAISTQVKTFTHYVGASSEAWRDPSRAKELAMLQFSKGVDVVFCAAGSSCLGVFDAAEEKKKYAIGVDSNQNWVKPGTILTSMVKGVDQAVYESISLKLNGLFSGGTVHMGLKENAISFSIDENNRKILTPEIERQALKIREQILSGTLIVPDFYNLHKSTSTSK
ncbi:MAG: BMP family ABC transporter substrate-binding protein [Proteobacteria bacterium]|nr:BMP family ABC transporter substrate-binding protein [Pseudomonadota bacterium]